jgi:hypothetical protein
MRAQDQKIVLEMLLLRMAAAPRIENLLGRTGSSASSSASSQNSASRSTQSKAGSANRSYSGSSANKEATAPYRGAGAGESSAQSRNFESGNPSMASAKDSSTSSSVSSAGRSSARSDQDSEPFSALGAQGHESHRSSVTSADDRSASSARASTQEQEVPLSVDPSQDLNEQWHALVNRIKKINPVMAASLENTLLTGVAGKNLKLSVGSKKKFIFDKIVEADFKRKALNYISTFWGAGFDYAVELGEEAEGSVTPRAFAQTKEEERQSEVRKAVENHPLVKATQSVFKTEIKSIKEMKS